MGVIIMAFKNKKRKKPDLYWITLFVLVTGVLVGAVFVGKYVGDKFVSGGDLLKVEDTSIKTLAKPTIVPHNTDLSYGENNSQVIVPPSFKVTSDNKYKEYSSKQPSKTPKPTEKPSSTENKDKEDEEEKVEETNKEDVAKIPSGPDSVPVTDNDSTGKIDTDLTQMAGDTPSNSTDEGNEFERIELEDDVTDNTDTPPPAEEAGDSTYKVQAGLYISEDNAQDMAQDLQDNGYDATVVQVENDDGKTYYRVQAGAFNDKDNAENVVTDLQENNYDVIIVNE